MHAWNLLHVARWKCRTQKITKKWPSVHHRTTLSGYIFATKAYIDNQKKCIKQQCLLHVFSQYGELRPTNGCDRFGSFGHPSRFQQASRLDFVTAPTSLNRGQRNFAWCLAVSSAGTLYTHFRGCCPLTEFYQVQNSLCIQVLHFPLLAALLHSTRVVHVSQTAALSRRRHLYSEGRPSRWASAHILVSYLLNHFCGELAVSVIQYTVNQYYRYIAY